MDENAKYLMIYKNQAPDSHGEVVIDRFDTREEIHEQLRRKDYDKFYGDDVDIFEVVPMRRVFSLEPASQGGSAKKKR